MPKKGIQPPMQTSPKAQNAPTILAPPGTLMTAPIAQKTDDLITNINEDDLRERALNFQDEDEDAMKPLVLGTETYADLFENRKAPKDRRPMPSLKDIMQ